MANDIDGIKDKIVTILESVTGIDKVYKYGIKNITAYTCADVWYDGIESSIPETNVTNAVSWRFIITVFIKSMDRKNADIKLAALSYNLYDKFLDYPALNFPTYVDSARIIRSQNGETNEFKYPYVFCQFTLIVDTEETRTG